MNYYEVHITVDTQNIPQFITDCEGLDIKPIVIETENVGINKQVMTSSKYKGDDYVKTTEYLKQSLISLGYNVLRV